MFVLIIRFSQLHAHGDKERSPIRWGNQTIGNLPLSFSHSQCHDKRNCCFKDVLSSLFFFFLISSSSPPFASTFIFLILPLPHFLLHSSSCSELKALQALSLFGKLSVKERIRVRGCWRRRREDRSREERRTEQIMKMLRASRYELECCSMELTSLNSLLGSRITALEEESEPPFFPGKYGLIYYQSYDGFTRKKHLMWDTEIFVLVQDDSCNLQKFLF